MEKYRQIVILFIRFLAVFLLWSVFVFFVWLNEYNSRSEHSFFGVEFKKALMEVKDLPDFFRIVFVHSWHFLIPSFFLTPIVTKAISKTIKMPRS
jgi:hypothetical protein